MKWIVWLAFLALLLFEIRYFHASFPGGKFQAVTDALRNWDVSSAAGIAFTNLNNGLRSFLFTLEDGLFYVVARYVFLSATIACLVSGVRCQKPTLRAAGYVGTSYALALWILYDVGGWRDLRSLAGVTAFLVIILALAGFKRLLCGILAVQLVAYPSLYVYRDAFIRDRVVPFKERMATDIPLIDAYRSLSTLRPTGQRQRSFLIIGIEAGLFSAEMSPELLSLPVRNTEGLPMRYTFERLRSVGEDEVDYLLTNKDCRFGSATLVTAYFRACAMKPQS